MTGSLAIVIPVLNDWDCLRILLDRLAEHAHELPPMRIMIVNDGSTTPPSWGDSARRGRFESVTAINLGAPVGHQRAIAVGLAHCAVDDGVSAVLVMDADGEDDPSAVPQLVRELKSAAPGPAVVVAQRGARRESRGFRLGYRMYKGTFRLLTGGVLDYGNFSVMDREAAQRLAYMPETWNHFAAAVSRSRLEIRRVRVDRATRYSGRSRMNPVALVNHGLAAMATYIDVVFARLLVAVGAAIALTLGGAMLAAAIRLLTTLAIPGWATNVVGFAFLALLQFMAVLVVLTFVVLATRSEVVPVPIRVAQQHVASIERIR